MTIVKGISQHCTYDGGRTVQLNDHTKWMWCGDNKKCSDLLWYLGIRDPILGMCSGDGEQLPPLIELAVTRQNTDIRSGLDTSECLQVTRQQHLHVINHKASNLRAARTRLGFFSSRMISATGPTVANHGCMELACSHRLSFSHHL